MIYTLNEPRQFNWTIRYEESQLDKTMIIAEGKCYDFIPRISDRVIFDEIEYVVSGIVYDFDESVILVELDSL